MIIYWGIVDFNGQLSLIAISNSKLHLHSSTTARSAINRKASHRSCNVSLEWWKTIFPSKLNKPFNKVDSHASDLTESLFLINIAGLLLLCMCMHVYLYLPRELRRGIHFVTHSLSLSLSLAHTHTHSYAGNTRRHRNMSSRWNVSFQLIYETHKLQNFFLFLRPHILFMWCVLFSSACMSELSCPKELSATPSPSMHNWKAHK